MLQRHPKAHRSRLAEGARLISFSPPAGQIETQPHLSGLVMATERRTSSFTSSAISAASAISSSTQSPISPWNGIGPLLTGTCATPEFSLVYGPQTATLYNIGIVGCQGLQTDCCPFPMAPTVATTDVTTTKTVGGPSGSNRFIFPTAASPSQVTLSRCPEDYVTISSVCCPS